jgi:hypothetical protein
MSFPAEAGRPLGETTAVLQGVDAGLSRARRALDLLDAVPDLAHELRGMAAALHAHAQILTQAAAADQDDPHVLAVAANAERLVLVADRLAVLADPRRRATASLGQALRDVAGRVDRACHRSGATLNLTGGFPDTGVERRAFVVVLVSLIEVALRAAVVAARLRLSVEAAGDAGVQIILRVEWGTCEHVGGRFAERLRRQLLACSGQDLAGLAFAEALSELGGHLHPPTETPLGAHVALTLARPQGRARVGDARDDA